MRSGVLNTDPNTAYLRSYCFNFNKMGCRLGYIFWRSKKNVTQQRVDIRVNVGLRYRATLEKLTQPTTLRYCLVCYYFLSKQHYPQTWKSMKNRGGIKLSKFAFHLSYNFRTLDVSDLLLIIFLFHVGCGWGTNPNKIKWILLEFVKLTPTSMLDCMWLFSWNLDP